MSKDTTVMEKIRQDLKEIKNLMNMDLIEMGIIILRRMENILIQEKKKTQMDLSCMGHGKIQEKN